jgi:protein-tyrosine phosphatase
MQITAGSLAGAFGRKARYWAERMLDEGYVHILATDAHDVNRRPPNLSRGRELAARRVGDAEAQHLVITRPRGVLLNDVQSNLPRPESAISSSGMVPAEADVLTETSDVAKQESRDAARGNFVGRLLRHFV